MTTEVDELSLAYLKNHPIDAGKVLDNADAADVIRLLEETPVRVMAPVLGAMATHRAAKVLQMFDPARQALLYKEIGLHRSAAIMRHIPNIRLNKLFQLLPQSFAIRLRLILQYPQGSVGSVMSTDIIIADMGQSVAQVKKLIRQVADLSDSDIYVVDKAECFRGCLSIASLFNHPKQTPMAELLDTHIDTVSVRESIENITTHTGWVKRRALPVVDRHNRLLGAVLYAAVYDAPVYVETASGVDGYLLSDIFDVYWKAWLSVIEVILAKGARE